MTEKAKKSKSCGKRSRFSCQDEAKSSFSRFDLRNGQKLDEENLHVASHMSGTITCTYFQPSHVVTILFSYTQPEMVRYSEISTFPHVFECVGFSSRVTSRVKWNHRCPRLSVTSAHLMWVADPSNDDTFFSTTQRFIEKFVIAIVVHGKSSVWVALRWRMCWLWKCRSFNETVCYCLQLDVGRYEDL